MTKVPNWAWHKWLRQYVLSHAIGLPNVCNVCKEVLTLISITSAVHYMAWVIDNCMVCQCQESYVVSLYLEIIEIIFNSINISTDKNTFNQCTVIVWASSGADFNTQDIISQQYAPTSTSHILIMISMWSHTSYTTSELHTQHADSLSFYRTIHTISVNLLQ